MGFISLTKIFKEYKKVLDSNQKLDERKKQIRAMIDEMREMEKNFDQLSDKAKQARRKQMMTKQGDIRKQTLEIRKEEDRVLREILMDVEKTSGFLRKTKKLTFIIDDRLVIDGPEEMDVSDELIKLLNERYKRK